jgi:hypothetical protein
MTSLNPSNIMPDAARQSLLDRLAHFRRKVRGRMLLEGAAQLAAAMVLTALLTFVLDRTFRLSAMVRIAMLVAAAGALAVFAWRQIIGPLRLKLDAMTLASALDGKGGNPRVAPRIATVMDLPSLLHGSAAPSAAMVHQAVAKSHSALAGLDFGQRLDDRRRNVSATVIASAILLPALIFLLAPATTRLWAARTFLGSNIPWPQKTYLQVAGLSDDGVLVVPSGEAFALRVSAKPGTVPPDKVSMSFRVGSGSRVRATLTGFAANDFRYDFTGISSAMTVEVWGGDDVLEPFTIRPAERPKIKDLMLAAQHPTQPAPQTYTFSGTDADLSFLPRTKMQLRFSSNTPIAEAKIASATTQPSQSQLHQLDDEHFAIDWVQEQNVQLQIELVSRDAHLLSAPTAVSLGLKIDQPPRVTLAYTGVHTRVTPRARIPLSLDARDDYGVSSAGIALKAERPDGSASGTLVAESSAISLYGPVTPTTDLEVQQQKTIELEEMKLPPGSLLTVNAAATDNCYVGAQTSQSRQVTFRIVPPEELFREILLREQAERAKFRKQTDEARMIRDQLPKAATAEAISGLAHRHRAVGREMTSIHTAITETVTELKLNQLATDQAYELIEKNVLAPLKTLNDEMINQQKDALDSLKPQDAPALAAISDRQDQIVARMEEILKQMSQWDSFVDVLNQLNEIIRIQDQAEQGTKQLKKKETDEIFEK